jgi:hypothetical protein
MTTLPPDWEAEMRFTGEAETNPQVAVQWHTVAFQHKDAYALEVLAQLLNGRTGRLYKSLVLPPNAPATQAMAAQRSQKYAGYFGASAEVKDGRSPEEVEKGLLAEVERLKTEAVGAEELQKVKNNFAAGAFRRLTSNMAMLFQLILNDGLGDWREANEGPKRIQAVTAEDVKRVAAAYLTKENRAVAVYTRKSGSAPSADEAALAEVPEQMRPMVKQSLARVAAETDVEKLKQRIGQLDGQMGQMPPEAKKGFELVLSAMKARVAELEKPGAAAAKPAEPAKKD